MSFDRLARHYSWMEWLLAGRKLQMCRSAFLREALGAKSILLVGEGHGRFLLELCRAAPEKPIIYLDASAEMVRVAKEWLDRASIRCDRVEFRCARILDCDLPNPVDLVVTQFFLDCFEGGELQQVVTKLASVLTPGGKWIVADFQVPSEGWRRIRARLVLKLAYSFFRIATALPARKLTPPQDALRQNGLILERRREFNFDLLYAELWKKEGTAQYPG